MAYELYQSRYKGYEIDNRLDDVGDLKTDVTALKTEYDANKVKMSDSTILPLHLVNTYATKTDLNAKADSSQVAADIATATTDMATNTGVASAIATATTDMATNASVASAIAAAAYVLPEATTSTLGGVKPDGTTITVDNDGTIHGASAIAELNDIGDVNAPNPQNDQVLAYDSATSKWVPKAGGGGGGTTYTAGDGIVIDANDEISTDNMPSTDMSEIVSPKPTVKTKQSSFDLLGTVSSQEGQITYPDGTLENYTFLLLKVNMKNGTTEIGRGNQILIPTVELKLGTHTDGYVQVQAGQSSPSATGGNSVNVFANFSKIKMSYIYVGWVGPALTNPGFIARLYGIK